MLSGYTRGTGEKWNVPRGVLRQWNASGWQLLTYRMHELYDLRANGANLELFIRGPSLASADRGMQASFDLGFGFSSRQVSSDESLNDLPRYYDTEPMIVSAGPDGEFGLYVPKAGDPQADRPLQYGQRAVMWAPLQLDYRCGRVDARYVDAVRDNVISSAEAKVRKDMMTPTK